MRYFGILMALVYVGAGIALLLQASERSYGIPNNLTLPLGIILIAYGAFRGYTTYKRLQ